MRLFLFSIFAYALMWGQGLNVIWSQSSPATKAEAQDTAVPAVMPGSLRFSIPPAPTLSVFDLGAQELLITSAGAIGFTASASTAGGGMWLDVSPTGTTYRDPRFPDVAGYYGFVNVSLNSRAVQMLAVGTYSGAVTLTFNGAGALTVPVILTVGGPPVLDVSPSTIYVTLPNLQPNVLGALDSAKFWGCPARRP